MYFLVWNRQGALWVKAQGDAKDLNQLVISGEIIREGWDDNSQPKVTEINKALQYAALL